MSAIRVQFKLAGLDKDRALALQHHVRTNLGLDMDLSQIVRNQFLSWMRSQIEKEVVTDGTGQQADATGDISEAQASVPGNELVQAAETGGN